MIINRRHLLKATATAAVATSLPMPFIRGALAASGKKLTFVFSRFDPGHDTLMMNSGALIRRLRRQGRVKVWSIDKSNHTFDTRSPRNELIASLERHLVSSYPTPPARRVNPAAQSPARQNTAVS